MSHFPRSLRLAAGIAVMATAAVSLAACSSDETAADSEAASATSLADFGSFEDLEAAAKEEGALNVIALPRDWANYGAILDLFAERYPEITINEASPDVSSAEEIQAAETNAGTDKAPDVFDLGLTVALQNVDAFAPYQVEGFDDIPESTPRSTPPRPNSPTSPAATTRAPSRSTATRRRRARPSRPSASHRS
jgi:putative spermidine/putrescine transport system substrate-binding protein